MSPQADVVTSRLRKTWHEWWTFSLWSGFVLAASVSLAAFILVVLLDALLKLPERLLAACFVMWAVAEHRGAGGGSGAATTRQKVAGSDGPAAWSWPSLSWKAT